jgi:transcriptional regulator with XRE-family HTH domain
LPTGNQHVSADGTICHDDEMPSRDAETFLQALAASMREERQKLGLSQDRWAAASGVDRGTISRFERLDRIPSVLALYDLAAALGKPLGHFVEKAQNAAEKRH